MKHLPYLFLLLSLAGCEIRPLYQKNDHLQDKIKFNITTSEKDDRSLGQMLTFEMEKRRPLLERTLSEPVTVSLKLSQVSGGIAFLSDAQASRYQSQIKVSLSLSKPGTKEVSLDSVSSYNVQSSQEFVIQATRQSTNERLISEIADQIQQNLVMMLKK